MNRERSEKIKKSVFSIKIHRSAAVKGVRGSASGPIVQFTGASTTHDKPVSLTCPVKSTDTREHYSSTYLLLVILVGVRGIGLAIPGSAVKCFNTELNPPKPNSNGPRHRGQPGPQPQ